MLHRYTFCALALICFPGLASALEIGFETLVGVNISDNVNGSDAGEEGEESGQIGFGQFGVFGEQKGTKLRGAFSGEFYTERQLDDSDDDFNGVTRFLGAADWQITPRSFSWYIGDILGGVRADDAFQPIDEQDNRRRNVFVTGPRFEYELDSFSRVNARLLYIDQNEDGEDLESLVNASASWEFDTDKGNTWGFVGGNIYTDNPDETLEGDFNRITLAGYWRRDRGRNTYEAQLGGTQYSTDDETLTGANLRFLFGKQFSAQSSFSVELSRDLRDESLTAIETLFAEGTGVAPDGNGFFDETRIDVTYDFNTDRTVFDFGVGVGRSDFRLLSDDAGVSIDGDIEDRNNFYASTSYGRTFTARTRMLASLSYEKQDFINRRDNSQSFLSSLQYFYRVNRSFEFQAGYRGTISDGDRTRNLATPNEPLEIIDVTENRLTLGFRWAPPTRASKELTIELNSLLE